MVTPITGSVWVTLFCSVQRTGEGVGCEVGSAGRETIDPLSLISPSGSAVGAGAQPPINRAAQTIEPTTTNLERAEGFPVIMTLLAASIRPSLRATKVAHYEASSLSQQRIEIRSGSQDIIILLSQPSGTYTQSPARPGYRPGCWGLARSCRAGGGRGRGAGPRAPLAAARCG